MIPLTGIDNTDAWLSTPNSLVFPARALLKPVSGHRNVLCLPASFVRHPAALSGDLAFRTSTMRGLELWVRAAVGYLSGGSSLKPSSTANRFFCPPIGSRHEAVAAFGTGMNRIRGPLDYEKAPSWSRTSQLLPF